MAEYDYLMKLVILGNSGVGKSTIINRYIYDRFEIYYGVGCDFF